MAFLVLTKYKFASQEQFLRMTPELPDIQAISYWDKL